MALFMSYCLFENTSEVMRDCIHELDCNGFSELSKTERYCAAALYNRCREYIEFYEELEQQESENE